MDDPDVGLDDETPFEEDLQPAVRRTGDGRAARSDAGGSTATGVAGDDGIAADEGIAGDVPDPAELVGPRRTLESRIQTVWVIQSGVSAAVVGTLAAVAFAVLPWGGPWVGSVVFTLLFVLGVVFAVLRYRSWSYEVREDALYLERGVLTHVRTVVPYVRIQHVDASRGPLERALGLATTVVYTAGSRGADVSIPGLTPERADDLQERLKHLAIAAEGEDAV